MSTFDLGVLPPYTSSGVVPSYSAEPASDEVLIQQNPRAESRAFNGTLVKKSGRETLVLANQDASAELPTYSRNAVIDGFVNLEDCEKVSKVVLKVKGKMELRLSERGYNSKTVLDDSYTLWSARTSNGAPCPNSVPFAAILPSNFRDGDGTRALPPTYNVTSTACGGLWVKVNYSLSVIVTRTRGHKLAFIPAKHTTTIPFNYRPRTRAGRPIRPPVSDFLADVKLMPGEWRQISTAGYPNPKSTLGPLDLHLFIPAPGVFALGDTIPFHIQLVGPVPSLREIIRDQSYAEAQPTVQVILLRQLLLTVNNYLEPCRLILGIATLSSTPPNAAAAVEPTDTASLDWAGELSSSPSVDVASFDAGIVKAQDFIVVDIIPPANSQFPRIRHSHPIRLVTESWLDE